MTAEILGFAGACLLLAGFLVFFFLPGAREHALGLFVAGNLAQFAYNVLTGDWWWAAVDAAITLLCAWWWHKSRRHRRRGKATGLIGAKARALRDSLVRKARDAGRPSPVLRPSLKGATGALSPLHQANCDWHGKPSGLVQAVRAVHCG